jgi:hypothetical protein
MFTILLLYVVRRVETYPFGIRFTLEFLIENSGLERSRASKCEERRDMAFDISVSRVGRTLNDEVYAIIVRLSTGRTRDGIRGSDVDKMSIHFVLLLLVLDGHGPCSRHCQPLYRVLGLSISVELLGKDPGISAGPYGV